MGDVEGEFVGIEVVGDNDGLEVVGLEVGEWDGDLLGVLEGDLDGLDVVGLPVGLAEGFGVGIVGLGVPHAPLSQLHASLAHSRSHLLLVPCIMNGEHPGAQSIV